MDVGVYSVGCICALRAIAGPRGSDLAWVTWHFMPAKFVLRKYRVPSPAKSLPRGGGPAITRRSATLIPGWVGTAVGCVTSRVLIGVLDIGACEHAPYGLLDKEKQYDMKVL